MKMLPEVEHASEVHKNQSNVNETRLSSTRPLVSTDPNQSHTTDADMLVMLADTPGRDPSGSAAFIPSQSPDVCF